MAGWERRERRDEPAGLLPYEPAGPLPYEPADPVPYELFDPPPREPVETRWPVVRHTPETSDVARRAGSPGAVTSVGGLLVAFAVGSAVLVVLAVAFIVVYRLVTGDPG